MISDYKFLIGANILEFNFVKGNGFRLNKFNLFSTMRLKTKNRLTD